MERRHAGRRSRCEWRCQEECAEHCVCGGRPREESSSEPGASVSRSFVAPCRAETLLPLGALVVVVKCDLPTYPDGATGEDGPPIRQGAGTLNFSFSRCGRRRGSRTSIRFEVSWSPSNRARRLLYTASCDSFNLGQTDLGRWSPGAMKGPWLGVARGRRGDQRPAVQARNTAWRQQRTVRQSSPI